MDRPYRVNASSALYLYVYSLSLYERLDELVWNACTQALSDCALWIAPRGLR